MAGQIIRTSPPSPEIKPVPFYEGATEDELPLERVATPEPVDLRLIGWFGALFVIVTAAAVYLTGGVDRGWIEALVKSLF